MSRSQLIILGLPLLLYGFMFLCTVRFQFGGIDHRRHGILDLRMTSNLTWAGLTFAVIAVILQVEKPPPSAPTALFEFSFSLLCFVGSYVMLHLRIIQACDTASDALTSNGVWAMFLGLKHLVNSQEAFSESAQIFDLALIGLAMFMAIDIVLTIRVSASLTR